MMVQPRRWAAVPVQELSGWVGSEDTHWMEDPLGAVGVHIGTGPKPRTCTICRDGCDWDDCIEVPTEMVGGQVVTDIPATLFDAARRELEPCRLLLCAGHAERVRSEPVELVLR